MLLDGNYTTHSGFEDLVHFVRRSLHQGSDHPLSLEHMIVSQFFLILATRGSGGLKTGPILTALCFRKLPKQ